MKKIIAGSMVLTTAMLLNASVASAWQFELENPDHDFTMELYFTPDEGTGNVLKDFTFAFLYDGDIASESEYLTPPPDSPNPLADTLIYQSWTYDAPLLQVPTMDHWAEYDMLFNVSGRSGVDVLTEKTLFATFTFSGEAVTNGFEDMWFATYNTSFSSQVDDVLYYVVDHPDNFVASGTSVAAVPLPASVLVFGSGLMGLVGLRRKKLSA